MGTRTTHSDMARSILDLAARLATIPAGYMVSDGSTLLLLTDAASVLVAQDKRIDAMTETLRACRDALPTQERARVNETLGAKE